MAVALYARVSTVRQAEKDLSIPDQLKQMRDWCKGQGFGVAYEYIEAGASATDDRRPVFQQMIGEATANPPPFDAIVVHSLSRFFRDMLEFGLYERRLSKSGVRVISISQQTNDDPAGEMARRMFSMFDEYQSKENGKHTLRAMKENARQGYFNGSKPTFGYTTVETEALGNKGKKKRMVIDPAEAVIVRKVFDLYLNGHAGQDMGRKCVAAHLNDRGILYRGSQWSRGQVGNVLNNRTYLGEFIFNQTTPKTNRIKPESEWVRMAVEPIIDAATFAGARERAASRTPANVPPRIVNTPTLLTGLLKCGRCGAGMTLATGKGGRYRYYRCQTRIGKGNGYCDCPNVSMDKLDALVLNALADKAFTPGRVKTLLDKLKRQVKSSRSEEDAQLGALTKQLKEVEQANSRLYDAVEQGMLPMDATLQARAQKNKAKREAVLTEIAGIRRNKEMPVSMLSQTKIDTFCKVLRSKLLGGDKGFAKRYLRLLVSEVRFTADAIKMQGSYGALAAAVGETGTLGGRVPSFGSSWLPDLGSNQGPAD